MLGQEVQQSLKVFYQCYYLYHMRSFIFHSPSTVQWMLHNTQQHHLVCGCQHTFHSSFCHTTIPFCATSVVQSVSICFSFWCWTFQVSLASQAEKQSRWYLVPEYIHPWRSLADGAGLPAKNLHLQELMTKTGHIDGMEAFPGWETDGSRSVDFLHGLLPPCPWDFETISDASHHVYESSGSKYRLSVPTIPMMHALKMTSIFLSLLLTVSMARARQSAGKYL